MTKMINTRHIFEYISCAHKMLQSNLHAMELIPLKYKIKATILAIYFYSMLLITKELQSLLQLIPLSFTSHGYH